MKIYYFAVVLTAFCIAKEAECKTNETMWGLLVDDIKDSHWLFIHTLVLSYYGELKSLATEAGSTKARGCAVASEILYTDLTKFGMGSVADCAKSESDVTEMNECCLKIGRRVFEAGMSIFRSTKKCIDEES